MDESINKLKSFWRGTQDLTRKVKYFIDKLDLVSQMLITKALKKIVF